MSGEKPGVDALLADREELGLGAIDGLLDLGRVLVPDPGDPARGPDEIAQDRLALDDPRVLRGVDRGRGLVAEAGEVGTPADRLELLAPLERLRDGDDVDRFTAFEQVDDGGVDPAVGLAIEVLGPQELGDLDHGIAVDEDRAEHGLLGFETLRRQAIDHGTAGLRRDELGASSSAGEPGIRSTKQPNSAPRVHVNPSMWAPVWTISWISPDDRAVEKRVVVHQTQNRAEGVEGV